MRTSVSLAFWTILTMAGSAQPAPEFVTVLYCYGGTGCQGYLTPFTYPQMDRLLNKLGTLEGEGNGKPVVFLKNNQGDYIDYVDMQRSLTEINVLFGGTGEPPVIDTYPLLDGPQPGDGNWTVTMEAATTQDCPPGVESAMAGLRLAEAGAVTFARPFAPDQALPAQAVDWLPIAPNHHRAVLPGSDSMFATYDLVVEGADQLSGTLVAVTQVTGQTPCTITMPVSYQRIAG